MSVTIYTFPRSCLLDQLFYAPGQMFDAGFTSGGVRVSSPEPGGRAYLDITPGTRDAEWSWPFWSWFFSKAAAGGIFYVPLLKTPQLVKQADLESAGIAASVDIGWAIEDIYLQAKWDNDQYWDDNDAYVSATVAASAGTTKITIVDPLLSLLMAGHVIGHQNHCYMVDDVTDGVITITPPLREDIAVGDHILLRPYFTGVVNNAAEMRDTYAAPFKDSLVRPNTIRFSEFIST